VERPDPAVAFRGTPPASALPGWYPELLASVTEHVSLGHRRAVAAANTELLAAYWAIGRAILERQHEEGYGTKVIDRLSADLRERFPDARSYSPRNLKCMRAFATAWPDWEVVQESLARLPWYHQIALIEKLDRPDLRLWYAAAALDHGWSRDVLAVKIEGRLHERAGKAISNFQQTLPEPDSDLAQQATRDPYLFDFLSTTQTRLERDMERGARRARSRLPARARPGVRVRGQSGPAGTGGPGILLRPPLLPHRAALLRRDRAEGRSLSTRLTWASSVCTWPQPTIGLLLCKWCPRPPGSTVTAVRSDGKAGVVWHTQGSGKSMEMELYTNRIMRAPELANPTVVVITDRTELDGQLLVVSRPACCCRRSRGRSGAARSCATSWPTGPPAASTSPPWARTCSRRSPVTSSPSCVATSAPTGPSATMSAPSSVRRSSGCWSATATRRTSSPPRSSSSSSRWSSSLLTTSTATGERVDVRRPVTGRRACGRGRQIIQDDVIVDEHTGIPARRAASRNGASAFVCGPAKVRRAS
jgi:predicted nuclease of restriction endonuclease-like (RecB) superfamily